jgi:hypothetical protein
MLAEDHREDGHAVAELVGTANGDEEALRRAALGARQGGEYLESSWANLTHRLLEAAVSKTPLDRLSDTEIRRLEALDAFAAASSIVKWRTLSEHEPGLSELESHARAGRFGRTIKQDDRSQSAKRRVAVDRMRGRKDLESLLGPLVGPEITTDDPVMSSRLALSAARRYLLEIGD